LRLREVWRSQILGNFLQENLPLNRCYILPLGTSHSLQDGFLRSKKMAKSRRVYSFFPGVAAAFFVSFFLKKKIIFFLGEVPANRKLFILKPHI